MPAEAALSPAFLRRLERLAITSRRPIPGRLKGENRTRRRGSGVEFADFREYQLGDDLRYVDWNTVARLDRHYLKLFTEEQDLALLVLVDSSAGMGFGEPSKLRMAASVAAAAGVIALSRYDRMQLHLLPESTGRARPARGRAAIPGLLAGLGKLESAGTAEIGARLTQAAARAKGVGIALLVSDLMEEGWQKGVQALLARGYEVNIVHVLSREEMNPTLSGDVRILDSETGDAREMSVSPALLARYQQRLAQFLDEAKGFCRKYGVGYHLVISDEEVESATISALRGTGMVGS